MSVGKAKTVYIWQRLIYSRQRVAYDTERRCETGFFKCIMSQREKIRGKTKREDVGYDTFR